MFTRGLAIACATATACSAVNAASFCDPSTDWTTEWADEFEGPEIDSEKWSVTVGVKPAAAASSVDRPQTRNAQTRGHGGAQESRDNSVPLLVGGNKNPGMDFAPEARHALGADCAGDSCVLLGSCRSAACTADNVYLENGTLVLRAQREQVQGLNYTTGAVNTRHKSTWTAAPGAFRMCISAKLPGSGPSGQGLWPAHWLMPNDDTCDPDEGEIDIMEMVDGTGTVYGTYHWQTSFPVANCSFPKNHSSVSGNVDLTGTDWGSTFHEYAVEHSPEHVAFVVDGKVLTNRSRTSDDLVIWPVSWYLILNTAIGGGWPGEPTSNTTFPTYHVIDYVRVARRSF